MEKKKNSAPGSALGRDEMKQIMGGKAVCSCSANGYSCVCGSPTTCVPDLIYTNCIICSVSQATCASNNGGVYTMQLNY